MKTTARVSQLPRSPKVVGSLPAQACVCAPQKPILGSLESLSAKSLILQSHNLISNEREFNLK